MGLVATEVNFKKYFQTAPIQFQERGTLLTLIYIDGSIKWHTFWRASWQYLGNFKMHMSLDQAISTQGI